MQMSYAEFSQGSSGAASSVPTWAQRANEPLVPVVDIAAVRKAVTADLKDLRKATAELSKLGSRAPKRGDPGLGAQLLSISGGARERAREASRRLRTALGTAAEGSPEQAALGALSDEFKQVLVKFQQQVEATTHLVPGVDPMSSMSSRGGTSMSNLAHPADLEAGRGAGVAGPSSAEAATAAQLAATQQQQEQQQQQVDLNESILAERGQGIAHLNSSVAQVAEIFQDLGASYREPTVPKRSPCNPPRTRRDRSASSACPRARTPAAAAAPPPQPYAALPSPSPPSPRPPGSLLPPSHNLAPRRRLPPPPSPPHPTPPTLPHP